MKKRQYYYLAYLDYHKGKDIELARSAIPVMKMKVKLFIRKV